MRPDPVYNPTWRSVTRGRAAPIPSDDTKLATATRIVVDALTESLPRCLSTGVYAATVGQVQQLVDGLDAETCLAWAHEIAPDDMPSFEAGAQPERSV
jgi:hypothetical protein